MFSHLTANSSTYLTLNTRTVLSTIGAGLILYKAFSFTQTILANRSSDSNSLAGRYGKDSWALITSASDDVGKAFVFELASRGFNIVLLGSDSKQLKALELELKAEYSTVKTRIVVADFLNAYTKGFAKIIYKQCRDLDISIIVNNVGTGQHDLHAKLTPTELKETVIINCLAHVLITRTFLPKLAARSHRSGIINVASFASNCPKATLLPSASSLFEDYVSKSLVVDHPNIDVLSLSPAKVPKKIIDCKRVNDPWCLNGEQCMKPALGNIRKTHGALGHYKAQQALLSSVPEFLKKYSIFAL